VPLQTPGPVSTGVFAGNKLTAAPARVLETAAGTWIVTRRLRDVLPNGVRLTATDLNAPMLEIARTKFRPGEDIEFQPADALALPFGMAASTRSSVSSV
jgi:ubiquinone/menaquinone biosynthesis C-methylase UbiE